MKRKFLTLMLSFCLIIPCVFMATACSKDNGPKMETWDGTIAEVSEAENNTITIETAEEFAGFAASVNAGTTYEDVIIELTCDMDLQNIEWTPIGYGVTNTVTEAVNGAVFKGTFDGKGYTIYNLKQVNFNTMREGTGLFGSILRATIKNLNINGAEIVGHHWVGALAGLVRASKVDNCNVENIKLSCVYDDIAEDNGDKAGAMIGYATFSRKPGSQLETVVTNCSVKNSTVNAVRDAGQLIGCIDASSSKMLSNNTALNVTVTANDSAEGTDEAGKKGQNIQNAIYGRFDAAVKINWQESNGAIGTLPEENNGTYLISTPEELAAFAKAVNDGNTFEGKTVYLTNDVDLGNLQWTPIGYGSTNRRTSVSSGPVFMGTFDGLYNTIYNFKITNKKLESTGFFGNIFGATIKNLSLYGAEVKGYHWVGTLVGFCRASEIYNCHVQNAKVSCIYDATLNEDGDKAGVLIGYATHSIDIYEQLGKDSEEDVKAASSIIESNSVKNSTVNAVRDAGQMIGCIDSNSDDYFSANVAINVVVSANNSADGVEGYTNQGSNIQNALIGRYDKEAVTDTL